MGYIYKITNDVNDKIYIGQTKRTLSKRWYEHKLYAKQPDSNNKLYLAMKEIGIDHFKIDPIEEVYGVEDRNQREVYWIEFYNSFNDGYNSTRGGGCVDWENASTLEKKDLIVEMRLNGATYQKITENLHCGRSLISQALKEKNLTEKKGCLVAKEQLILEEFKQGHYLVDICKEYGCAMKTLQKLLKQHPEFDDTYYNVYHPLDETIWDLKNNQGLKAGKISEKLNCCDETVHRALNRYKKRLADKGKIIVPYYNT